MQEERSTQRLVERNRLRNKVAKRILELDKKKIEILREGIKGRIWGRDGKKEGGKKKNRRSP